VIAQRNAFCDRVNGVLAARGLQPIDCELLDQPENFQGKPVPPFPGDLGACGKIWKPEYVAVTGWLNYCPQWKARAVHWHEVVRWNLIHVGACSHSPIVLDLAGDGVNLTSLDNGVRFDLLGNGPVQCSWIQGDDAMLALDRDGNGRIDGARELFGNSTAGKSWSDGFAALAELDWNHDGRIDGKDPAFDELVLWRDTDHDGVSSPDELVTLRAAGIRALFLGPASVPDSRALDAHGNEIPLVSGFERMDGTKGLMVDAYLRFRPLGADRK
jgi:hypothetical protein